MRQECGGCGGYRPAGRFIASVLLSVAVLVASLVVYVKLAEVFGPIVKEVKRVLSELSALGSLGSGSTVAYPLHAAASDAALRVLNGYALLEITVGEGGECRVYVNGTLVYDAPVDPGDYVKLYLSNVSGRVVASRLPPRGGRFSGGVVAVRCGGVEKVWDLR